MNDKTIGAIASELLAKTDTKNLNPQEVQRAQEQEYLDNLIWAVKHAQKKVDCSKLENHDQCKTRDALEGSFFVAAILKKEKLLENVLRNYFIPTQVCPTPTYDQTVYRYNHEKDDIEYIWTVPDRETCLTFKENVTKIVPEERALLANILDFYSGALYRKAKEFNGEKMQTGGVLEGF